MRFSFTALAFPLLVSKALSLETHTVTVSELTVRNIDNVIEGVSFKVDSTTCSGNPTNTVIACGDSAYRFGIEENAIDNYNLSIYEETGPAVGLWQMQQVELICRAGGSAPTDYICDSFHNITYTLSFDGQS